ncbi:hypothetical protein J2Z69_003232 [Paenibacillus shirakamiensis]|uniref:HRDC domain-containing protein n=1 Tax=Paenibacillus shirakamiensis TaxID=1265935 RepID=A0ABS4JKE2_9BACL|nr:HRDC domain-containing protein [Paenibacillus shirakamiensis]MBP2002175.1 hypothetical protein [Paenibacillus shirakamiensis]
MRIVFLNSMEKRDEEGLHLQGAQVWIGEEEGIWRMGWKELSTGKETLWYEDTSWSEMLHVYRHRLASKLSEGFRPSIEGVFHDQPETRSRPTQAQKLICYSELHTNDALFAELSAWRRRRAQTERKAPYLIASNRLLRLISTYQPQTIAELMQLPGVGESKSAEYGAELIALLQTDDRAHDFPLVWVEQALDPEESRSWVYKQKEMKYRVEMERFGLRRQLQSLMSEGLGIEEICVHTGLSRREVIEMIEELDKEGYEVDLILDGELQHMSEEEQSEVWKAYEELGDTYLKPILQRVYGMDLEEGADVEKMYEQLRLIRIRYRRRHVIMTSAG